MTQKGYGEKVWPNKRSLVSVVQTLLWYNFKNEEKVTQGH